MVKNKAPKEILRKSEGHLLSIIPLGGPDSCRSLLGRTPTGACNYAPFSEGFLKGFSRLLSRRI